mgnify:CR=1 FL=1
MKGFIQLRGINKDYGQTRVLSNLDLDIDKGELVAIRGASGSGKSTLLYLLGGLERPTAGQVLVNQRTLGNLSDDELASYRNSEVGCIFQFHVLLPSLNAWDNILLPARIGSKLTAEVEKRAAGLAATLGVTNKLKLMPHELSGGEQQRVNIVRALALRPQLLLCDEPTGNLDSKNSEKVTQLLKDLAAENSTTLLVVTHDDKVASAFPRKIVIEDGQIIR